ncbi:MAG: hypothetical protein I3273_03955 [Candidatus Moeniiplasma glomeromycotorum]|nr:hypothetical protein [Candidatus Moeniiplasma glomeromycotorum]MCE8169248.1 hypothetical protein [Candidatus Moeniiplasma glomeromycotorum]
MVNFNLQIKSEYSFYVFTTEIYNLWKDNSFLKDITLPKDYNYNGKKGKMVKEREFKKIYHAVNKIYNGICTKIEIEVLKKKKNS